MNRPVILHVELFCHVNRCCFLFFALLSQYGLSTKYVWGGTTSCDRATVRDSKRANLHLFEVSWWNAPRKFKPLIPFMQNSASYVFRLRLKTLRKAVCHPSVEHGVGFDKFNWIAKATVRGAGRFHDFHVLWHDGGFKKSGKTLTSYLHSWTTCWQNLPSRVGNF